MDTSNDGESARDAEAAAAELAELTALIERSVRTAGSAVADSVAYPARQMTAAELTAFWQSVRLVAMATVGPAGQPHIAPVHAQLSGTTLRLVIYDNTVRRRDLQSNPRVAFTAWGPDGAAAILDRTRPGGARLATRITTRAQWGRTPGRIGRRATDTCLCHARP